MFPEYLEVLLSFFGILSRNKEYICVILHRRMSGDSSGMSGTRHECELSNPGV